MGPIPGNFPISLRAWPSAKGDGQQLPFIQRIDYERGGFLNVTEESLKQEIAEAEASSGDDDEAGNAPSNDGQAEEPDRNKGFATEEQIQWLECASSSSTSDLEYALTQHK